MPENSIHFEAGGDERFAAVFSCPGRLEKSKGRPVAGQTGTNLELLLEILGARRTDLPGRRSDLTITNAWSEPEYDDDEDLEATGRTEATILEIVRPHNITRLGGELAHVTEVIFCFGDRACVALCKALAGGYIRQGVRLGFAPHLGMKGLNNSISVDINGDPIIPARDLARLPGRHFTIKEAGRENTRKRLEVIAQELFAQV